MDAAVVISAVGSTCTVLAVIVGASYTHGKLTKTVETHGDRLEEHKGRLDVHDTRLNDHSERIGRLEGFVTPKR